MRRVELTQVATVGGSRHLVRSYRRLGVVHASAGQHYRWSPSDSHGTSSYAQPQLSLCDAADVGEWFQLFEALVRYLTSHELSTEQDVLPRRLH